MSIEPPSPEAIRRFAPQLRTLLIAALAASGLLLTAIHFDRQATDRLTAATAELEELKRRQAGFVDLAEGRRQQVEQYDQLVERHILGPEQRMQWIQALQRIKTEQRLLALHYDFAAQQPLGLAAPDRPFRFVTSPTRLELVAAHDGDLVGVLEALGSQIPGYVRPRRCLFEKTEPLQAAPAPLRLTCEMDWITIQPRP